MICNVKMFFVLELNLSIEINFDYSAIVHGTTIKVRVADESSECFRGDGRLFIGRSDLPR
jgi:hypothetical protein